MTKSIWIAIVVLAVLAIGAFFILGRQNTNLTNITTPPDTSTTQESTLPTPVNDSTGSAETGTVKEFTVEGSPFKFTPASLEVNQGDRVKITFKNMQGMHDFVIDELNVKTQVLRTAGAQEVVEFVADKKGSFTYYCSVPGHRAQGMEGTLVVN